MSDYITRLLNAKTDMEREQTAKDLAAEGAEGVTVILSALKTGNNTRLYLNTLAKMMSRDKCRYYLNDIWGRVEFRPLLEYSQDADPKTRKNAYVIMGSMLSPVVAAALKSALTREKTLFLIPSVILAAGNTCEKDIAPVLRALRAEYSAQPRKEEEKHYAEILRALDKAQDKLSDVRSRPFLGLDAPTRILLTAMEGQERITFDEAKSLYNDARYAFGLIEIITADYPALFRLRTFYEALIALEALDKLPFDTATIAEALYRVFPPAILQKWYGGDLPYRYRIDLNGEILGRVDSIEALSAAIGGVYKGALLNSPSNYELEIRLEVKSDKCSVRIKPSSFKDPRFLYRINALPASIKGENAAVCVRLVSKYLKSNARVLDPFAGTGTMLIERAKAMNCSSLTGTDIYGEAVRMARGNAEAAGIKAEFVCTDILNYRPLEPFDEIISNMPYGLRVGTHKENETLYAGFAVKALDLLKSGGIMVLLTADYHLLVNSVRDAGFRVLNEFDISSGGLTPKLFVFKKVK